MTIYLAPGLSGIGTRARALSWEGKSFTPGYCLLFQLSKVFKVPGVGDYDRDGDADCNDYWRAAKKRGRVVETTDPKKIPAGALLIWTGRHGHAAYYLGDGKILGTDLPKYAHVGIAPITEPARVWGHKLVGYVEVDGNGYTLRRPKAVTTYVATAQVNVRNTASTRSKILRTLKVGEEFTGTEIVTAGGRDWIHTTSDHYVALEFATAKE